MLGSLSGPRPMGQRVKDARKWASTTPGHLRVLSVEIAVVALVLLAVGIGTLVPAMGTVYLQAASNLMHGPGGILAQVDDMRDAFITDLDGANVTLKVTLGLVVVYAIVTGLLLVLLIRTQHFVRVRFRRRRNSRLLAAT